MITLKHTADVISEVMNIIEKIDFMNSKKTNKTNCQTKINEAYNILNRFNDEIIRETIIIKQRRAQRK